MKVKIQTRQVYHKFAEVEIEVCEDDFEHFKLDNGKWTTLQDYLICKEELYTDKIDEAIFHGTGLYDFDGHEDAEADSEWRYECDELHDGGHL
jgi:hypothetical protein